MQAIFSQKDLGRHPGAVVHNVFTTGQQGRTESMQKWLLARLLYTAVCFENIQRPLFLLNVIVGIISHARFYKGSVV